MGGIFFENMTNEEYMRMFEGMTIRQLRELTAEFLAANPQFETAQEMLDRKAKL